jgi:hypothetical protein
LGLDLHLPSFSFFISNFPKLLSYFLILNVKFSNLILPHPLQANLDGKVNLVLVDVPRNLLVPLVSTFLTKKIVWNMQMDDHIVSIFNFVEKFLTSDGVVLFSN